MIFDWSVSYTYTSNQSVASHSIGAGGSFGQHPASRVHGSSDPELFFSMGLIVSHFCSRVSNRFMKGFSIYPFSSAKYTQGAQLWLHTCL